MAELSRYRREISNALLQGKLPDFYLDKASSFNLKLEDKLVIFSVQKLHDSLIDKGNTQEEALKSVQEAVIALSQHVMMLFFQVKAACPKGKPDPSLLSQLETDIEPIRNNDPVFQKPPPELIPLLNEVLQSVGFRERVTGEWAFQTPSDPEARHRQFDNVDALAVDLELLRHELPLLLDGQHPVYPRYSIAPVSSSPSSSSSTSSSSSASSSSSSSGPGLSSVPHLSASFKPVPSTSTSTSAPPLPLLSKPTVVTPVKKLYQPKKPVLQKTNGDSPPAATSNKCSICGNVVPEFWWCKECAASGDPRGKKLLCAGCRDRRHPQGNKERENHTFTKVAAPAPEPDTPPPQPQPEPEPPSPSASASAPSFKGFPKAQAQRGQLHNNLDDDEEYHSANEGDGDEVQIEDASGGPASRTRARVAIASSARQLGQAGGIAGRLSPSDGIATPAIVLDDDEMLANRRILTLVKASAAEQPAYTIPEVRHALKMVGNDADKALAYLRKDYKKQIEQLMKNKPELKCSFEEARDAFVECKWNAAKASQQLREQREQAVALVLAVLPGVGRARVSSALNESDGDLDAALTRLSEATTKRANKALADSKEALSRQRTASASSSSSKDTQLRLGHLDGRIPNPVLTYPPYEAFLRNKTIPLELFTLSHCNCNLCMDCARLHFHTNILNKGVTGVTCPGCEKLNPANLDDLHHALSLYATSFKRIFAKEDYELFEKKLVEYNTMKDPNFRWCAWCKDPPNGYIWQDFPPQRRMRCNVCNNYTCFECKRPWEKQHESLSCEEFARWKQDNDPNFQERGLSEYLEQNGIDCPNCKFRYMLSRGGCYHFICKQCKFQFCAGCNRQIFTICKKPNCRSGGLHAHHPRSCFYYLRDYSAQELETLLKSKQLDLVKEVGLRAAGFQQPGAAAAAAANLCGVMEQKERIEAGHTSLVDEACGAAVYANGGGLCEKHYKEYLVTLINRYNVDPAPLFTLEQLRGQLLKANIAEPPGPPGEQEAQLKARLLTLVLEQIPLERSDL